MNFLKSTTMTRPNQKEAEHHTLRLLLSALGMLPNCAMDSEAPDHIVCLGGQTVGVEVVAYHSGRTVGATGITRRKVEAEWERFEHSSKKFREQQADLDNVGIVFRFRDVLPNSQERQSFLIEIVDFVRSRQSVFGPEYVVFSRHEFTSPLMLKYLTDIALCVCDRAGWDSNVTAGLLGPLDESIARIVAKKSEKTYRQMPELWLVIQCSHRISETALPINGVDEFRRSANLQASLRNGSFSRVYVLTPMGLFQWDKVGAWQKI
jgi:hypothetical protein